MLYSGGGGLFPIPWCIPGCPGPIICLIPGIIMGPMPGCPRCMPCIPPGPGPRIIIPFISILEPLGIMPPGPWLAIFPSPSSNGLLASKVSKVSSRPLSLALCANFPLGFRLDNFGASLSHGKMPLILHPLWTNPALTFVSLTEWSIRVSKVVLFKDFPSTSFAICSSQIFL